VRQTTTTYTVDGLAPFSSYDFSVSACTEAGRTLF